MYNLEEKIAHWDASGTNQLELIYSEYLADKPNRFKEVIDLCLSNRDYQIATTWLVKHRYDLKSTLPDKLTDLLLLVCPTLEDWQAKLHMLQLIPFLNLSEVGIGIVDDFSLLCLQDKNKFVRAWAYEARYKITTYIPEYKSELKLLCEDGMMDSPSVQVRVLAVLKRLEQIEET